MLKKRDKVMICIMAITIVIMSISYTRFVSNRMYKESSIHLRELSPRGIQSRSLSEIGGGQATCKQSSDIFPFEAYRGRHCSHH